MVNYTRIKINYYKERQDMVAALANSGYKVWVIQEEHGMKVDCFVCFEGGEYHEKS